MEWHYLLQSNHILFMSSVLATIQIDIPRRELSSWTVVTLRTVVCFKLGINPSSSQNDILALEGGVCVTQSMFVPLELVVRKIRCSHTPGYSSFSYPYQVVIHHTFLLLHLISLTSLLPINLFTIGMYSR